MSDEIYYKMTATIDGVETYTGQEAKIARIAEWLDTPEGQVWGAPHWGNELSQYRHMPMNGDTAAAIENHIASKLPEDIPDVSIASIKVTPVTVDCWRIQISISGVSTPVNQDVKL
ncbi:hypothetical protein K6U51_10010 [Vibrio fluvialis]|uniref:hypothetical protein n=1 Tax=Vibrio fluvialis TaxID=676 RepID=UPI001EE9B333|nr:hypothetical protein [Vibrio fluvialis]MCG6387490.1 hypothetical protein [Vibrio fluvialis]MCG6418369.1 hypothetical protein [Vibrio fluvialis]